MSMGYSPKITMEATACGQDTSANILATKSTLNKMDQMAMWFGFHMPTSSQCENHFNYHSFSIGHEVLGLVCLKIKYTRTLKFMKSIVIFLII